MIDRELYRLHAKLPVYRRHIDQAREIINGVLQHVEKPYIAFSCGKDSTVLAHMVLQFAPATPLRFLSSGETRLLHNVDDVLRFFGDRGVVIQEINIDRVFSEEWKNATWDEQRKVGRHDMELLNDSSFDGIFMGLRAGESRVRKISLARNQTEGLPRFCHRYRAGKRKDMIRCCPLANWTVSDIGAYIVEHDIPYLDWYGHQGFEGRTTARLTGDAVRQYTLTWLKKNKFDSWNRLLQRFPELSVHV